jgi:hypothetical protein
MVQKIFIFLKLVVSVETSTMRLPILGTPRLGAEPDLDAWVDLASAASLTPEIRAGTDRRTDRLPHGGS